MFTTTWVLSSGRENQAKGIVKLMTTSLQDDNQATHLCNWDWRWDVGGWLLPAASGDSFLFPEAESYRYENSHWWIFKDNKYISNKNVTIKELQVAEV